MHNNKIKAGTPLYEYVKQKRLLSFYKPEISHIRNKKAYSVLVFNYVFSPQEVCDSLTSMDESAITQKIVSVRESYDTDKLLQYLEEHTSRNVADVSISGYIDDQFVVIPGKRVNDKDFLSCCLPDTITGQVIIWDNRNEKVHQHITIKNEVVYHAYYLKYTDEVFVTTRSWYSYTYHIHSLPCLLYKCDSDGKIYCIRRLGSFDEKDLDCLYLRIRSTTRNHNTVIFIQTYVDRDLNGFFLYDSQLGLNYIAYVPIPSSISKLQVFFSDGKDWRSANHSEVIGLMYYTYHEAGFHSTSMCEVLLIKFDNRYRRRWRYQWKTSFSNAIHGADDQEYTLEDFTVKEDNSFSMFLSAGEDADWRSKTITGTL